MLPDPPTVHVGLLLLELRIPKARSLKEKRKSVLSLKNRISNKFNASVAEVGELDKWQIAILAVTIVSNDQRIVDRNLQSVIAFANNDWEVELISSHIDFC